MGNKISDYLERFRIFCGKELTGNHYIFYGNSSYHSKRKDFYCSFINNDVFNPDSELHQGVFDSYDSTDNTELLIAIIKWVQNYIKSFKYKIRDAITFKCSSINFKPLDDAIQLIFIFKAQFSIYYQSEFNGTCHSIFDNNPYCYEYADNPFTNTLLPASLIDAKINDEFCDELNLNYIIGHDTISEKTFEQFNHYFCQDTSSNYTGMLFFTYFAMKQYEQSLRNDHIKFEVKDEDGYYYISLECGQMIGNKYIPTSSHKIVFHVEGDGTLYRLVAFNSILFSFDFLKHKRLPDKCFGYCSDERFIDYLANTNSTISKQDNHIDIFI